jgi:two-component system, OmpR family, phosphate regulon sensor histidine kinase PhoR
MKKLWNRSLVFKFFVSYLAIVTLLFASFYFYSRTFIRNFYISSLSLQLDHEAHLLGGVLPFQIAGSNFDSLCQLQAKEIAARITVIADDGRVLCDSHEQSSRMENHATRPEVVEALSKGTGASIRPSTTVGETMLYRAFLQTNGDTRRTIRLSVSLKEIENVISSLRWTLLGGLLVVSGFGLLLTYGFSRYLSMRVKRLVNLSQQLAGGQFPRTFLPHSGHDEIYLLEQNLNEMSAKIRHNIDQVIAEKEKGDSILQCMLEGVLVLDSSGHVLVINEKAKQMFHVVQDRDIQGVPIVELSRHPEMRKIIQEVLTFDFTRNRYSKEIELDEGQWFRVNAVSLRHGTHGAVGSILVFHDITEIKRLETMRSDFVANVSHELRTPLTAIRGYVETLLHRPPEDPKDSNYFLAIVERHSERLSRLTEDLLALSDLESGKVQLARQPVDAAQLIQRVLEVFWAQADAKKVKLKQVVEAGLPPLLGDSDRLQQLFINLVDNAVKYTPSGGQVSLAASTVLNVPDSEPRVEISVADTGPGIPEKDLPRLTERFYRVDKARSRDLGGTGLGLAIVKHIVQAHKGELKIESILQKGTTVRVFLPAAKFAQASPEDGPSLRRELLL